MSEELLILAAAAASIGLVHTLTGPDHYLPFVMMAYARKWRLSKTLLVTLLCGLAHVMSSVVLGLLGIALGIAVGHLEMFEAWRGNVAAWVLIAFGLAYAVWGLRQAIRNRPHTHHHRHDDVDAHEHEHVHHRDHAHVHLPEGEPTVSITPWVLFVIFVLGPCEPLIPLLMYPAAKTSWSGLILVTAIFLITTVTTMLVSVTAMTWGAQMRLFAPLERYAHGIAGLTILVCGLAIQFLGL